MYINREINWIKQLMKYDVYVWGAGEKGKTCIKLLKNHGIRVKGCFDNNPLLDDRTIEGEIKVYDPKKTGYEKIKDLNAYTVVCSVYEREISMQLIREGITNFVSVYKLDFGGGEEFYDESYFEWQKEIGKENRKGRSFFCDYITPDMNVIEFGSGGGFLLQSIEAKNKIGVEINPFARSFAEKNGVKSVKRVSEINDDWGDIVISSHALEHVENPLETLKEIRKKIKNNGKIVFAVPSEPNDWEYKKSDINNHLYSWNCLTLGNLFKAAGFYVLSVERRMTFWPEDYEVIRSEVSEELFKELARVEGYCIHRGNLIICAEK